jgi:hypothetical protein
MTHIITDVRRKTPDGKTATAGPLTAEELRKMDTYWRASNYLVARRGLRGRILVIATKEDVTMLRKVLQVLRGTR